MKAQDQKICAMLPERLAEAWIADGLRGTVGALFLPFELLCAVRWPGWLESETSVSRILGGLQWASWLLAGRLYACAANMSMLGSVWIVALVLAGFVAAVCNGRKQHAPVAYGGFDAAARRKAHQAHFARRMGAHFRPQHLDGRVRSWSVNPHARMRMEEF